MFVSNFVFIKERIGVVKKNYFANDMKYERGNGKSSETLRRGERVMLACKWAKAGAEVNLDV